MPTTDTLLRHGLGVRFVHGLDALVVLVLLVSGLALSGDLPSSWVVGLGGHEGLNTVHRLLGIGFVAVGFLWILVRAPVAVRFLRRIAHFRRTDIQWFPRFALHLFRPSQHAAPHCGGHFDPAQRLVFIGIVLSLALSGASGTHLYLWTPQLPGAGLIGQVIVLHVVSTWALMALLCLHVLAGSGVLWTHRGLVRAMFGNGRVSRTLARRLWPDWAASQRPVTVADKKPE